MDPQAQDMYSNRLSGNSTVIDLDDFPTSLKKSNFTPNEDRLLVSAWLNSSRQGMHQRDSRFWEKAFKYFQRYKKTTTERTIKALSDRWSCIEKASDNFCGCLAQVEWLYQSGMNMTEQEKFDNAKIMYQSLEKCDFLFEHCWSLLKDQPKWSLDHIKNHPLNRRRMVPPPTPTSTTTPMPNVISNEVIELDRPMGKKAEKGKRKAQGRQAEEIIQLKKMKYTHTLLEESRALEKMEYDRKVEYERLKVQAEKLRIEAEMLEFAKKEADQRIMMMDLSGLSEIQQLYFKERQRETQVCLRYNRL